MKFKIFFLLLTFLVGKLNAQKLGVKECVDYAIKNHISLQKAQINKKIAEYSMKETIGIGLPQVNASFDFKHFIDLPTSLIPAQAFGGLPGVYLPVQFGTNNNATLSADVSQLIFDGSYIVGLKASKVYIDLVSLDIKRTEQEVASTVAKGYYSSLLNQKKLAILTENIAQLDKILKNLMILKKNGVAEQIDVDRIQVQMNNLETELVKATRLVELSKNLLKYQMGMNLDASLDLVDILPENVLDINVVDTTLTGSKPEANRIEFQILDTQIKLQKLNIKRYYMGRLPQVVGFFNLSTQQFQNEFKLFDTKQRWYSYSVVGLKINIPIFDGLKTPNRIKQEKQNLLKFQKDLEMLKQGTDLELANANSMYSNSITSLTIHKRNVALSKQVYDNASLKYNKGVGTNIEVLQAESAMNLAQTNYLNALMETYVALVDIKKADGTIMMFIESKK